MPRRSCEGLLSMDTTFFQKKLIEICVSSVFTMTKCRKRKELKIVLQHKVSKIRFPKTVENEAGFSRQSLSRVAAKLNTRSLLCSKVFSRSLQRPLSSAIICEQVNTGYNVLRDAVKSIITQSEQYLAAYPTTIQRKVPNKVTANLLHSITSDKQNFVGK